MTSDVLYLRDLDSLAVPATGDAIFIMVVKVVRTAPGLYDLVVEGLAIRSTSCDVTVTLDSGATTQGATPDTTTGHFTSRFVGQAVASEPWVRVAAKNTITGATGREEIVLAAPK